MAQAVTVFRYPYLQDLRRNSVVIMWATLENGNGTVLYSTDKSFAQSATATAQIFPALQTGYAAAITQYEARLSGLAPDTVYFYRVQVNGQDATPASDVLSFRTPGPGAFTFLAFGDSGSGSAAQQQVLARMSTENPALVLHVGDIAYLEGTFDQFQSRYFNYYAPMMKRTPFYPIAGNHEYLTSTSGPYANHAAPFVSLHSLPDNGTPADRNRYYSFDRSNVHFVGLDANLDAGDPTFKPALDRMLAWLDDDLAKSKQFWRVVYWHQPPYAYGPNQGDPLEKQARDLLVPILEKYDVQLVLNGHEHNYQRSYPIRGGAIVPPEAGILYLTIGGGGAPLYAVPALTPFVAFGNSVNHYLRVDVNGGRMTIAPVGVDGSVVEQNGKPLVLQPPPSITSDSVLNAASFSKNVAPGSLISIFGRFVALAEDRAAALPLPATLSGTQVFLNGRKLPLLYVSRSQINAQLPFDAAGSGTLRVTTANGFSEAVIHISPASPGIFLSGGGPAVLHQSGSLVTSTSPALPGEFLTIYLTGVGAVTGDVNPGDPAPGAPALSCKADVSVTIGNLTVAPSFAGLTPGFAGLYQVNFQVPGSMTSGVFPLAVSAGGVMSNEANLAVQARTPPAR